MENSEITDNFQHISEANLVRRINEIFEKIKELDYRELMRLCIDPKTIRFQTKPSRYESFFYGKKFYDFMYNVLNYCKCLLHVEKKQKKIVEEAKEKKINSKIAILQKEREEILDWGQKISFAYTSILTDWIALKSKKGQFHLGTLKQENEFWEIVLLITVKIAERFFLVEDFPYIEEEISRLFKTEAFNTTKRKRFEKERVSKFPEIQEPVGKENIESTINRLSKQSHIPIVNWRYTSKKFEKSDVKPCYTNLHIADAIRNQSTLAAFIEPTGKYRMLNLEIKRKQNINTSVRRNPEASAERVTTLYEKEVNKSGPTQNFLDLNLMALRAQRRYPSVEPIKGRTKRMATGMSREGRLETSYVDFEIPNFRNERLETSYIVNNYIETRQSRLDTSCF